MITKEEIAAQLRELNGRDAAEFMLRIISDTPSPIEEVDEE